MRSSVLNKLEYHESIGVSDWDQNYGSDDMTSHNNQIQKLRVLIGKLGLDGHDRGVKIIAKILRDAGVEVIFTGLRKTPQDIARIAIEEDVDIIGISLLSGAHETLLPKLCELLKENDAGDIAVVAGGIIPRDEIPVLKQAGVKAVFGPGATSEEIINCFMSIGKNE
jgi:methylmalonyl-CoA mutase, C-terminal domain